jgi:muramoyltetrapeptide carboxypeptidase LdcA involved in peptidoglycan recycling
LKGYLKDGPKILVGHRDMHFLFLFFNNSIGWLVMQYKMSLTNALWSPKNGPPIPLWQIDDLGHPKLLERLPNLVSFDLI